MITTTVLMELYKIVNVEHSDPHSILGMHEILMEGGKTIVAVRQFVPQAKSITVIDAEDEAKKYEMTKIHEDGFFEAVIDERDKWFKYELQIRDYEGNEWKTYDSYEFAPTISEYDRYLFNAGNHYRIFEKLGSHITTVDGVEGVSFAVWAPNAKSVSVIGSFNNWDGRRNQMRTLGESGIWECFIPSLKANDKYKYQVKAKDNSIRNKTDPYGVYTEVRPDTASIVYDLSYEWDDEAWMEKRATDDIHNSPMNIYEVHLGSWMRIPEEGNRSLTYLESAERLIPYVKEMGYTHIELMPVEEHPFDGSWGYQVTGYYAPTSRFGTPVEFKKFVDLCHQNGLGVYLDWVPAHFPKDAHGLAKFDGTALYEHADSRQGEHPDWGTLIFNYGRNEVKNFLIANAIYWIDEYHIDGLRVDAVASMLYLDYGKNDGEWVPNEYGGRENLEAEEFLKHMNSVITGKYPGVMMMAEESTAWPGVTAAPQYGGLGFTLKWNMGWMNDFLTYIKKDCIYRQYHHGTLTFSMVYAFSENYVLVLSHDEVVHGKCSMINKMPGDLWQKFANLRAAYGFMFAHPGKKLNFMGNEIAQFDEWSEAKSLDWHLLEYDSHKGHKKYMQELNMLYKNEKALWDSDFDHSCFEWIDCNDNLRSIVSFMRRSRTSDEEIVVICNFTPETYFDFRVGVSISGLYREIMNSDAEKYGGSGIVNRNDMYSERIEWNGRQNSVGFRLPPLSVVMLKRIGSGGV